MYPRSWKVCKKSLISMALLLLFVQVSAVQSAVRRSSLYGREALVQDVQLDIVTEHIPWAKPLSGGPIRGLFIGPMYGHRETAELAQRLSLDFDVIFPGTTSRWTQHGSLSGYTKITDVLNNLHQKLDQQLDCIDPHERQQRRRVIADQFTETGALGPDDQEHHHRDNGQLGHALGEIDQAGGREQPFQPRQR